MTNRIKDIIIGLLILVICIVITILTKITFWWVFLPIFFMLLLAILSHLLQQRLGKTYGITFYLGALLLIPAIWYIFCTNMPITSVVADTQKKSKDLESFKEYSEGVDAKQQFVEYQVKQDSILKEQVALLLNEGKVDSALALVKQNATSSEKIKNELFSDINSTKKTTDINSPKNTADINSQQVQKTKITTNGDLAVINDPDGYTNIRSGPGTGYNILGIVKEGEFFEVINRQSQWWQVKSKQGITGYMHKSRIKLQNK